MKYGTKSARINPIYFYAVPEINLADHVNVAPNSTAAQLSRGPRGFAVGEVVGDGGDFVFKLADPDETEVGRVPIPEADLPDDSITRTQLAPAVRDELDEKLTEEAGNCSLCPVSRKHKTPHPSIG